MKFLFGCHQQELGEHLYALLSSFFSFTCNLRINCKVKQQGLGDTRLLSVPVLLKFTLHLPLSNMLTEQSGKKESLNKSFSSKKGTTAHQWLNYIVQKILHFSLNWKQKIKNTQNWVLIILFMLDTNCKQLLPIKLSCLYITQAVWVGAGQQQDVSLTRQNKVTY